ncbi:MAG TPA: prephenate dehydrogenase/arogenate dehydrogenase family protein [Thermoanaerobaculia bacterium]|nr:prephenate dehydrogenase/arogenate dehydrogenase family protein [Thermoanaerobaculia bacterium]
MGGEASDRGAGGAAGPSVPAGPILILGCGVVGASAAAGWSAAGHEVWGHDRRDLAPLVEKGWIARQVPAGSLDEAIAAAAVVLLALPVGGILAALRRLPFRAGHLVTDVGSVKAPVMAAAAALPAGVDFVGGHPIAGSEESGHEAARADLFAGATWALVSSRDEHRGDARSSDDHRGIEHDGALARVAALVGELGAVPLPCDAAEHDRVVALTSHLPQLLATALAAELEMRDEPLAAALLGAGGRAFLRLAGSSFDVWRDVIDANRGELERALAAVAARAGQPVAALAEEFALARAFATRLRNS